MKKNHMLPILGSSKLFGKLKNTNIGVFSFLTTFFVETLLLFEQRRLIVSICVCFFILMQFLTNLLLFLH